MNVFRNRAISASAGTGKTWALAHRYLALLAAGVEPDRVCALTFSRKAAGEIFDTIVERLCLAASDAHERANTAKDIARQAPGLAPPAKSADYLHLLRRLLDQAHRLRIGTLDSFILSVVRAFPLELGLPPDAQPMNNDGAEAQILRQALLARLYDPRQREREGAADRTGAALLAAFREATFGTESKGLARRLDKAVVDYYGYYRRHGAKAWGAIDRVWPAGRWWEDAKAADRRRAGATDYLEALRGAFGDQGWSAQLGDTCARIAEVAALHAPDRPWPAISGRLLPELLAYAPRSESPTVSYYKKDHAFPAPLWPPMRAALANLVGVEVARSLQKTAGLRSLLERYDDLYGEALSRDGRLSFEDLSRLLGGPGRQPSRQPDAPGRLYVDYRLDGRLDHWLLDEFQDTSDAQWNAISNLVDEVVQDAEGRRSFFYVGDIKQSIYGWRGGNYRLFGRVRRRCGIATAADDALVECHRSLPAVVRTVNAVFGGLAEWTASCGEGAGPSGAAVAAFLEEWREHRSARTGEGEGFAALLEYESRRKSESQEAAAGGEEPADGSEAAQFEAVAGILREVKPAERGLSAAVLVRSNDQGRACADVLRRRLPGVPVVHEGTGGIVDNPVVTLLLALVRYAAHSADTLAARHLQMSPLAPPAGAADWLAGLPGRFLAQVYETGFAGALRAWGRLLAEGGGLRADDAFGRQRLREMQAAAEAFDASGSRDADAFDDFIRSHQVKSEAAAGSVRVMTVHQSKGLGFDVVLVPLDPAARSFGSGGGFRMLRSDCGGDEPDPEGWVLQPPPRDALQAAGGAPLEAIEAARAEENFAQLCVLYVALTRARNALYVVVPRLPARPEALREADLLRARLAGDSEPQDSLCGLPVLYAAGDRAWCSPVAARAGAALQTPHIASRPEPLAVAFSAPPARREPSKEQTEGKPFPARWFFGREAGDVRAFGSALHRLFERIEWIEDADVEAVLAAWRAESVEAAAVRRDVETQFRRCLASAEVRALLARPAGAARCEVWRETPFDFVREGAIGREIVAGRFDRVAIERDAAGRPLRATVVDFKSNRVADETEMDAAAEGYRGQMRDYAAAAARLLGLPAGAVRAKLLFTRLARAREAGHWRLGGDGGEAPREAGA